jgi:hypothetical protein
MHLCIAFKAYHYTVNAESCCIVLHRFHLYSIYISIISSMLTTVPAKASLFSICIITYMYNKINLFEKVHKLDWECVV